MTPLGYNESRALGAEDSLIRQGMVIQATRARKSLSSSADTCFVKIEHAPCDAYESPLFGI